MLSADLVRFLDDRRSELPEGYTNRKAVVGEIYDVFRNWAASVLEKPLQQELASWPQSAYEDKKRLVHWVNSECRTFGLAVACPKTGKPSLLLAHKVGSRKLGEGAFTFEIVGDNNKKVCRCYRSILPEIALVPDSFERAHWADYVRERCDRGRS